MDKYIEHYIKNIRAMQMLSDAEIRAVMLHKIDKFPEYFEIIASVTQSIDTNKLIRQVMKDTPHTTNQPQVVDQPGRKVA